MAARMKEEGEAFEKAGNTPMALAEYKKALSHLFEAVENNTATEQETNLVDHLVQRIELLEKADDFQGVEYDPDPSMGMGGDIPDGFEVFDTIALDGSPGKHLDIILAPVLNCGYVAVQLYDGWARFDGIRRLLEILVGNSPIFNYFFIKTREEWRKRSRDTRQQPAKFVEDLEYLIDNCAHQTGNGRLAGVTFQYSFSEETHRRLLNFDNNWIVDLDYGLNLFLPPNGEGPFYTRLGFSDYSMRRTRPATIIIYKRKGFDNVKEQRRTENRMKNIEWMENGRFAGEPSPFEKRRKRDDGGAGCSY